MENTLEHPNMETLVADMEVLNLMKVLRNCETDNKELRRIKKVINKYENDLKKNCERNKALYHSDEDFRKKMIETQMNYYNRNRETILKKQRVYQRERYQRKTAEKEKVSIYKKGYKNMTPEERAEYHRKYYELNKDKLLEQQKERRKRKREEKLLGLELPKITSTAPIDIPKQEAF